MKIQKALILTLLLTLSCMVSAQIKIPGTSYSFSFPNNDWRYLETTTVDKNTNVYLYCYSGHYVVSSTGDTTLPFMRIYVRKHFNGSIYDMIYQRSLTQPFQSLDEYTYDDGSMGYLGAYTSPNDKKDYEFRMVYLKEKNTMIEIRLETLLDTYDEFDEMFLTILNSIKAN